MPEIKQKYNELQKKHKLPDYNLINNELEISTIEEPDFLLRTIMRRILEKLDFYTNLLQDTLQPDASNMASMNENNFFDDNEKKHIYNLYKKLISMNREGVLILLKPDEKNEAEFTNYFFEHWEPIRKELYHYVNKMKESWKADIEEEEDTGYMG